MAVVALLFGDGGTTLLAVTWTWTTIATILFVLRTWYASREPSKEHASFFGIRWDYAAVTIAYAAALASEITTTVGYRMAYWTKPLLESLKEVVPTIVLSNVVAYVSMIFGRFAIIALLLSLQGTAYRQWRISLWIVGGAQAMVLFSHIIITICQCNPPRKLWDLEVPGNCHLQVFSQKYGYASGSVGAFADFYLAIYPAIFIIGPLLKLPPSLRVGVCIILGGGLVAGIAGIVKMTCINDVKQLQKDYARFVMWQLTEAWFIVIFGTIPTVKPFFLAMGRGLKSIGTRLISTGGNYKSSKQHTQSVASGTGTSGSKMAHKPTLPRSTSEVALTDLSVMGKMERDSLDDERNGQWHDAENGHASQRRW
ncbi:uncharacterized protein MYCFIDRAFT_215208 [Pseudocercospora fijiensis CIRAD86]|uniref:Rhodopsin domain-containing protein n=1 Tax=Pseudocercospora fijiensis (strain CIRAD86) TaxID=383855 RepID=M3B160_PSEFD|nr:uncharacterized protein MYCFIDRAFT_215208 [Pseudocercospora fijiensis CIRAD86]EME83157.1 hypothetical protein MYCFIDRAFT_215208 [Pseudocercospora fijiensis CIRAD86]